MRIAVFGALTLAIMLPACAQVDNGNITGRVTDPTGASIVRAQVTTQASASVFVGVKPLFSDIF
jgi:hypothetical protein